MVSLCFYCGVFGRVILQELGRAYIHPAFCRWPVRSPHSHLSLIVSTLCVIPLPGDMYRGVCSEAILSQPVLLSLEGVLMRSLSSNIQPARLTSLVNYTLYRALRPKLCSK